VASYTTDTFGGAINFGYPIKETARLGFSFGISQTDITAGRFAVQEIKSSPRLLAGVDGFYESTCSRTAPTRRRRCSGPSMSCPTAP
jgi:outer membrane protein insertion porin family